VGLAVVAMAGLGAEGAETGKQGFGTIGSDYLGNHYHRMSYAL